MTAPVSQPSRPLRIGPEDAKPRMEAGEAITVLDARGQRDWESSPVKVRGALRIHAGDLHIDPSWPRERLTVVY